MYIIIGVRKSNNRPTTITSAESADEAIVSAFVYLQHHNNAERYSFLGGMLVGVSGANQIEELRYTPPQQLAASLVCTGQYN